MKAHFCKTPDGFLAPASDEDKAAIAHIGAGEVVNISFTRMRNYWFFRRWWALIRFAYDLWEPPELPEDPEKQWLKKVVPEKNLERFRKDVTILAGYYEASYRLDGSVRIEAKSISFAQMSEEEFADLYQRTIDIVIKHVCTNYTGEELDALVDEALRFAA